MRHYLHITEDGKLEVRFYPQDIEMEVGSAVRLTKQEALNLASSLIEKAEQME